MWKWRLTISLLRIYGHLAEIIQTLDANAWVDDLTGRLQRPLKKDFTICRVNRVVLSGSNAQLTTRPAMMMVVGKKQAENRGIRCNCFKLS